MTAAPIPLIDLRPVDAGVNSRLDEMQGAIVRTRLPHHSAWTERRREAAAIYRRGLPAHVSPTVGRDAGPVYDLFPVRTTERDALQAHLRERVVETLIQYPLALSARDAFARGRRAGCPVAERAARELLSLPLRHDLSNRDARSIAEAVAPFPTHNTLA